MVDAFTCHAVSSEPRPPLPTFAAGAQDSRKDIARHFARVGGPCPPQQVPQGAVEREDHDDEAAVVRFVSGVGMARNP